MGSDHHYNRWWHLTLLAVAHIVSRVDGLGHAYQQGQLNNDPTRDGRVMLGLAETAAIASQVNPNNESTILEGSPETSGCGLRGTVPACSLLATRVNLSAAEKMGAVAARRSSGCESREYLGRAVGYMSDAIDLDPSLPELYIERGALLAKLAVMGAVSGRSERIRQSAADFATALRLDGDIRRYQPGCSSSVSCLGDAR